MKKTPKLPAIQSPPQGLNKAGKAYWKKVLTDFQLENHHLDLLLAACQQLDRAASAAAEIALNGVTVKDRFEQVKTAPAVDVERNAHLTFCRLQRELGLDIEVPETRCNTRPGTRR